MEDSTSGLHSNKAVFNNVDATDSMLSPEREKTKEHEHVHENTVREFSDQCLHDRRV